MEYVLSIDTTSTNGSLSLFRILEFDNTPAAMPNSTPKLEWMGGKSWGRVPSHSEFINVELLNLLSEHSIELNQLNRILVTNGPGSFTGVRIGICFAKTLAYGLKIPAHTIDSLIILAHLEKFSNEEILVMRNAHKNSVYMGLYKGPELKILQPPRSVEVDSIQNYLTNNYYTVIGDGFDVYKNFFPEVVINKFNFSSQNPVNLAKTLGEFWFENQKLYPSLAWFDVLPLYIRASEAEEKLWKNAQNR